MSLIEITHRSTSAVLFALETESLKLCVEAAVSARANLADANLAGAYLAGANLTDAYLADANLAGAYLAGAYLAGAYLAGANLARANLAGANLAGANLTGAYLAGAYLTGANLARANLAGANLAGANLADANLAGAEGITDVLTISPIGSRRDALTAIATPNGVMVRTGCFHGSLDDFAAAVTETHGDNEHARHYRLAIELTRARFGGATEKQEAA